MGFSADRVASGIKRLQEAQLKKSQQRMDRLGHMCMYSICMYTTSRQRGSLYIYICIYMLSSVVLYTMHITVHICCVYWFLSTH